MTSIREIVIGEDKKCHFDIYKFKDVTESIVIKIWNGAGYSKKHTTVAKLIMEVIFPMLNTKNGYKLNNLSVIKSYESMMFINNNTHDEDCEEENLSLSYRNRIRAAGMPMNNKLYELFGLSAMILIGIAKNSKVPVRRVDAMNELTEWRKLMEGKDIQI